MPGEPKQRQEQLKGTFAPHHFLVKAEEEVCVCVLLLPNIPKDSVTQEKNNLDYYKGANSQLPTDGFPLVCSGKDLSPILHKPFSMQGVNFRIDKKF